MTNVAWARRVLGVGANASEAEIKKAFRRAAKATHPDRDGTVEAFNAAKAAYDLLMGSDASTFPSSSQRAPRPKTTKSPLEMGARLFVQELCLDGQIYPHGASATICIVEDELLIGVDLSIPWKRSSGMVQIAVSEQELDPSVSIWSREVLQRSFSDEGDLVAFWFSPLLRRMRVDGTPVEEDVEADMRFFRGRAR